MKKQHPKSSAQSHITHSTDGATINYLSIGEGPGVVIVPGLGRMAHHYEPLASLLGDTFTVHIINRRGRGESDDHSSTYSINDEVADVEAVLAATKSKLLFGHSFGGLVALHVALSHYPLEKNAVYDPGVSINGSLPTKWIPDFDAAYKKGDLAGAQAILLHGLRLNAIFKLPVFVLRPLAQLLLSGENGKETAAVMKTYSAELHELSRLDSDGSRYKSISTPTLIMGGTNSTDYFLSAQDFLHKNIKNSKLITLPGLDHNAPDLNAPEIIADQLKRYFTKS